ncbi:hypothetical protein [Thermus scotoductus]|uniref:ScoMcrA-like SRA domain-containing protein n=1 Tax=Thermus scotoductus TaxID=37636 RepID=A0A430V0U6_THESC|nr:hypothetical protein [Thermus scotoductus]RTI12513.1 hypothetical protein CSW30_00975 [Thermus scotoductus]RTI15900.1 hypothetical protein CSW27_04780 [Thermus scotoductus]
MSSLSWSEVFAYHRTRKGIGKRSLLVDRGESGYRNVFLPDGCILYQGEGKRGNQEPVGGNLRLLLAQERGTPLRIFLRERPGLWQDLGCYRVEGHRYSFLPEEGRWVYWFTLAPCECEEGL